MVRKRLTPQRLTLSAANASPIATYGTHTMSLNFALRRDFTWPLIVADVSTAILGADFLSHFGLMVDVKGRRLVDSVTSLTAEGLVHRARVHSIAIVQDSSSAPGPHTAAYARMMQDFTKSAKLPRCSTSAGEDQVHHFITTSGPPCFERPRRLSGERLTAAKKEFDALLAKGVVRVSASQWASPLHLVQKKSGGWRVTGDYRRLNACTIPDRYPLPNIEDLLQDCHGCNVFSTIDLERAYYQVPVAEEDIPKTAVTTPFGLFEFMGMPMGLRNASQTFQRHMDVLLRGLPFVRCYLDDLLVLSASHEEHQRHLRLLFDTLLKAGLTVNADKCVIGQEQVVYLGYLVSRHGYEPPPHKVQAIKDFPLPQTVSDLRRFLGMLNFYRRCIPRAAQLQAPLNEFLKGAKKKDKSPVPWTPESVSAFGACKGSIAEAVRPSFIQHDAKLALTSDASDTAIGAVLEQLEGDTWHPIGFFSRKLSDTEKRYSTYDRELLAVFAATKFFRRILEGRPFTVRTDHRPLIYAPQQRSDKASPRQQRQLDFLLQFQVSFEYVSGPNNVVADALSRTCAVTMPSPLDPASIAEAQQADDQLPPLQDDTDSPLQQLFIEGHDVLCNVEANRVRPYLPPALRRRAFDTVHGLSHPSIRITVKGVTQRFFWPDMKRDVTSWARGCESCQRAKVHKHNRAALGNFDTPDSRFDHVHVDIIKLPLCGGLQYCLTVIDRFSRWPVAVPLKDIRADTVAAAFFEHWICHFGTPLTITSDQGSQFESSLFTALSNLVGAKRVRTAPYHPQSNGMVERLHRTIKAALMCTPLTPWPQRLPSVLLGLRSCLKEDLQASPAEMLFGTPIRIPGEFFVAESQPADPLAFLSKFRRLMSEIKPVPAARHISPRAFQFKELNSCSHVYKRVEHIRAPLEPPYSGPHEVVKRLNDRSFVIRINGADKVVSTDSLKPAFDAAAVEAAIPTPACSQGTPPPTKRRVSFLAHTQGTGGGVDVAVEPPHSSSAARNRRRHQ